MSKYTGLPLDRVEEECDRENFLKPQEAIELGIIDDIVE
jgi:ATP-dependent Clp protease protease subunit